VAAICCDDAATPDAVVETRPEDGAQVVDELGEGGAEQVALRARLDLDGQVAGRHAMGGLGTLAQVRDRPAEGAGHARHLVVARGDDLDLDVALGHALGGHGEPGDRPREAGRHPGDEPGQREQHEQADDQQLRARAVRRREDLGLRRHGHDAPRAVAHGRPGHDDVLARPRIGGLDAARPPLGHRLGDRRQCWVLLRLGHVGERLGADQLLVGGGDEDAGAADQEAVAGLEQLDLRQVLVDRAERAVDAADADRLAGAQDGTV
jgi:hypothetical protein